MNHWLVKSEPDAFSYAQLEQEGFTEWSGIRNYQARNHLRAMQPGDLVLFFHPGDQRAVVGIAKVKTGPQPDTTASEGAWVSVVLEPEEALASSVPLADIKAAPLLRGLPLVKQSRLSVSPVPERAFQLIVEMGRSNAGTESPARPRSGKVGPTAVLAKRLKKKR